MSQHNDSRLHRRLTLNSISNLSRYALSIAIAFFLTPFIVRTLGDSQYGFWVLLMSFVGYAGMLEMGVQPAVVKLVGQYKAVGDREKLQELITAALVFFLVVGTIAAIFILTVVPAIVQRHVDGLQQLPRWGMLFAAIALDALIMYMNYLVRGILYGWQRYHLKNVIDASGWLLNAALVVSFLEAGGILALVLCKLVMDLSVLVASTVAVHRLFPDLRLNLRLLHRSSFGSLMGFGGRVFLSATTTRIATNAQPVIISTALSSAATSFYAIPVKLVDYTRQIAYTLTASFMPMFSELESRDEREMLRSIYLNYSRYIFLILLPIPVLLFVYGPAFIGMWIGPEYAERGTIVLYLLTTTVLIESFQPLLWRFFIGVAHLNILVKVSAAGSALVVVAGIALVKPLGIAGVALSVLVGAVLAQTIYAFQACAYLRVSLPSVFAQVHMRPLLVAAFVFGFAELLASTLGQGNYLVMATGAILSVLLHASLGLWIAITREERAALRGIVSRRLRGRRPSRVERVRVEEKG